MTQTRQRIFDPLAFVDKRAKEIKVEMDSDNSAAINKAEKDCPKLPKNLNFQKVLPMKK